MVHDEGVSASPSQNKSLRIPELTAMKSRGEPISMLTAYDATMARLLDQAGIDVLLVGDSLGMVIQGHDTTVPVTMDHVVYHCAAVSRGLSRPFLMADLPFMSYSSPELALGNAVRLMQEGGASMLKLESGPGQTDTVAYLARHDIAVCAHLGLKPQSVHKTGGFRVQGREEAAASAMLRDARALEAAGADMVLLECVPATLGRSIAEALSVPVIGIGAGPGTDGQILVLYDILDLTPGRKPRFARNFLEGSASPQAAIARYVQAVKSAEYPAPEHCF
jgi:3-methyl-2-oxobutanoate hydroxymethyltransferase